MKTWRSIVKTARTVMSSRLFVCLMALCLAVNTIPTASVAQALEGVTGEPTTEEVVLTDEAAGDETAPDGQGTPTEGASDTDEATDADDQGTVTGEADESGEAVKSDETDEGASPTLAAAPALKSAPLRALANGDPYSIEGKDTYATLQDAVNAAADGDTIVVVGDATETSDATINKSVTLQSDGSATINTTGQVSVASGATVSMKSVKIVSTGDTALLVKLGATLDSLDSCTISAAAVGLDNKGKIGTISNSTISGGDHAVYDNENRKELAAISNEGTIGTLDGVTATSDFTVLANKASGTIGTIQGGSYKINEYYGGQHSGEQAAISNLGTITTINGPECVGRFNAVYNNGTIVTVKGKGSYQATSNHDNKAALYNDEDGVIESIEDGSFSSFAGASTVHNNGTINEIKGGSYTDSDDDWTCSQAVYNGDGGIITKISGGEFTCYNMEIYNDGTIGEISGGTFKSGYADSAVYNAGSITTISGGEFENQQPYDGYTKAALDNDGTITTISGGSFKNSTIALLNGGTINTLSGGFISSDNCAIFNWSGTIETISVAEEGDLLVQGGNNVMRNYRGGSIGKIEGHGIYVGGDCTSLGKLIKAGNIESTGDMGLNTTGANPGYGRYKANIATTAYADGILPTGYHMSKTTTTVTGQSGDFHFLAKDGTVIYRGGEGHDLTDPTKAAPGFPNQVFTTDTTAADNKTGFEFAAGDKVFTGWNTQADGKGTAYKAGDTLTVPEGEELVLYAQWKDWTGPVNINHDKQYETIEAAMKEAKDGDVIYVRGYDYEEGADADAIAAAGTVTETAKIITVDKNVTIVADPESPHEKPLSVNAVFEVAAGKTLTMGDPETSTKTLTLKDSQYTAKGTMVLNDNTEITQSANKSVITVNSGGTLEANGGSVTADKGRAIYNNGGTTTITGGTLTGKGSNATVENRGDGTLAVKGGTISAEKYQAIDNVKGTITEISGGTIKGGRIGNASDAYRYGAVRNEANGTIDKITGDVTITANSGSPAAVSNEGTITLIDGGTFNGVSSYAFYNGKTATAKIDEIKGGTFQFADTTKGTAFQSDNGTIGTISGGTFSAMSGIVLNGGTIDKITGGTATSTTSAALKVMGGITVPEISGGSFTSNGGSNNTNSVGIEVTGAGSKITKITGVETIVGKQSGLKVSTGTSVDIIENCTITGDNRGIYIGANAGIDTITGGEVTGKDGIYLTGDASADKATTIGTIDGVTINATDYGIHMGGTGVVYTHIDEIKGATKIATTANHSGIYLVNEGASIDKITGVSIDSAGTGISNQGGTIGEITSATVDDVTIKAKSTAINNYKNGTIGLIAGYGTYESQGASAISNAQGSTIMLESDGTYDLATEKPHVGYGRYKSSNAAKVIDDASKFDITDGYAMSTYILDDGYYHLVEQLTVAFNSDGGTPDPDDQTVGYGAKATKPETDPSKTGYTFDGWNKGEAKFDFSTAITENTDLKATYIEHTYTIAFDKNASDAEGETESMTGVKYTEKKALTENGFTRAGHDFAGWNTAADGSGNAYDDKAEVEKLTAENNGTVTLYAQWTARTDTPYVVKHLQQNVDNDEYTEVEADRENLTGTTDTEVTPAVKTYAGFTSPATQTVTIKGDGTTVVEYKYTRNTVKATFDASGGDAADPASIDKKYGAALGELPQTSRTGYTFDGWYTDAEGGEKISPETTMPAEDTTYYAHWTVNQYTITFDSNGGSAVSPITQDYGTDVALPASPTRTGHTFAGWEPSVPQTMPAENVTVKARWAINSYPVNFDSNGGSAVPSQSVPYGSRASQPANPRRSGYTFAGWVDGNGRPYSFSTPVTGPLTLTARWTANPAPAPAPAPAPTPAAPVTPAPEPTPAPEQPAEPEQVPDEPTPAAPTPEPEVVPDEPAPLTPEVDLGAWALLNLIAAAVTVLLSAFRLGGLRGDEDEDDEGQQRSSEDEEQRKNRRALRLATLVPAIGSVIAFILTEDMSLPMQLLDRWTPLMVAILVAQAVLTVLARNKDEEQDEQQATA